MFSMEKKVYKNRIRVVLADNGYKDIFGRTAWSVKDDNKSMVYQYYTTECSTVDRDIASFTV